MRGGRLKVVLSGYLLAAVGAASTNCCAQPQQTSEVPSAEQNGAQQKTAKQEPSRDDDSSNLPADPLADSTDYDNSLGLHLLKNLALDQKAIWTSPARIRPEDTIWLVPLGGLTAGLIATDTEVSKHQSNSPSRIQHSKDLSNYGLASLAAVGGGLYLWGHITHDDHKRETGLLAGEAALNSLAVTYAAKYAFGRERPLEDDYQGKFWQGGDSFPSEHSAAAWSIASVIAHEYPGPLTTLLAYGAASAISLSRVSAKQHFPSDVLIGNAIGWFVGEEVYRRHHDPELGGCEWKNPVALLGDHPYQPKDMGSPYVPLDSWIYPALNRLEAWGYVPEGFLGQRPWTRMECARLISDASDKVTEGSISSREAIRILQDLNNEFASELNLLGGGTNRQARVESVYTRVAAISGRPLNSEAAYDFGQTIVNDDGRPYEQGGNVINGGSGWATAGPLVGYARVEHQYAPSTPALPLSARLVIQQVQLLKVLQPGEPIPPIPPGNPIPSTSQVDLLDGYVGIQFDNWAITFGKQEQWWGPDQSGPMLFSNNAAPIEMFEINRVTPFTLPGIFRYVGPIRVQFFLGQLTGQNWVNKYYPGAPVGLTGSWTQPLGVQPAIDGFKISFKPTPNFEVGMGVTTILAGSGVALTPHKIFQAVTSFSDTGPGSPGDPGDRLGGFDFTYRFPKLRNWLTLYGDAFTNDEISPWVHWTKAAVTAGIYMPRIPKIPKLDLRAEGIYTDAPAIQAGFTHGFFYYNDRFVSGYTNNGNLIGSWIGRQGQGADAWATYWFTPKDTLQLNFRHEKVSKLFIPQGGTITDAGARASVWLRSTLSLSASLQYETWDFPVISATRQTDVTTSFGVTFWPTSRIARSDIAGGSP